MSSARHGVAGWAARLVIAALLVLSLLPVPNWFPSERSVPWYSAVVAQWLVGGVWVVGGAVLLGLLCRRWPRLWREGSLRQALGSFDPARPRALAIVAIGACLAYLAVAVGVFDRRPLLIDEVVQVFQARTYAGGRLWLPVDADPAFRSTLNIVEYHGRWFGHFPPGWALLLAAGELVGASWVVGPVVGGLTVGMWGLILRRIEPSASIRAGALLLFAFAPFTLFMAASHMNHGPVLFWLLAAVAGWLAFIERPRALTGVAIGLAFGMAVITRPADAAAFAAPALVWALIWVAGPGRPAPLGWIGLGVLPPLAVLVLVNGATTGGVLTSGYQLLWGSNVGLGFHPAPYGPPHTAGRGFELIALYLLRLNTFLFEAPIPGLVMAGAALGLSRPLGSADRYLLGAGAVLLLVYFAYWHDGFFLGPRFVYPLVPLLALWTVRLPSVVAGRFGDGLARRACGYAMALALAGTVASGLPARLGGTSAFKPVMRFDADRVAAAAGIHDAVIFVRESWGSQLLARMWALGVSRPDAEWYYRNIDGCRLDGALAERERSDRTAPIGPILEPLMADSAKLVRSPFSPDSSERVLDGARYDGRCVARINEDRQGATILAPHLLSRRPDLWFGRDLQERNRSVLAARPTAAVYLMYQPAGAVVPVIVPVSRDSILALP